MYYSYLLLFISNLWMIAPVKVDKDQKEINHIMRDGITCTIHLEAEEVEKAWAKELKNYGKVKTRSGEVWLEEGIVPNLSETPLNLLSTIQVKNGESELFVAFSESQGVKDEGMEEKLEQYLYDFAIGLLRQDLQNQIEAADKAVREAVRNHEKKEKEGEHLKGDLSENEADRKTLEQELLENMRNHGVLLEEIKANKLEQEAALESIEELRKITEEKHNALKQLK